MKLQEGRLSRMDDVLESLTASMLTLQTHTQQSLQQMAEQAERTEQVTQRLERSLIRSPAAAQSIDDTAVRLKVALAPEDDRSPEHPPAPADRGSIPEMTSSGGEPDEEEVPIHRA